MPQSPTNPVSLLGLLRNAKLIQRLKPLAPALYENAANTIDAFFDPQKAAMQWYAKEFNPRTDTIKTLQNAKDWLGMFSDVPMAPPFLGRGESARGYLPPVNLAHGFDTNPGLMARYDPYYDMMREHNTQLRDYETSQDDVARRPFDDWRHIHDLVQQRHNKTMEFQAKLRKDPQIIAASKGDPKLMAQLIHQKTIKFNENAFNPGDYLRGYLHYTNPLEPMYSLKMGPHAKHSLELPDMTGKQPYIIR